jgi:hypothetical protein
MWLLPFAEIVVSASSHQRGQLTHMKRIPDRHASSGSPSQGQRTCGVMGYMPFEPFPWLAAEHRQAAPRTDSRGAPKAVARKSTPPPSHHVAVCRRSRSCVAA